MEDSPMGEFFYDTLRAVVIMMKDKTLAYYDENASTFIEDTRNVDFSAVRSRFLKWVVPYGLILDLGCGSGRDAKAFMEAGYHVDCVDGSQKMCELASAYLGIPVVQMDFNELEAVNAYDGVWACSSLLHAPKADLPAILHKIELSLKPGGIFYCSFKEGDFEGMRDGRYFSDLSEEELRQLKSSCCPSLSLIELWHSTDVRPSRTQSWLNALYRKGTS